MARRKTIMKEHILKAAENLLKREGIDSLTARNVANELDCSTQPIYNEFKNMEQLKQEVIAGTEEFFTNKLSATAIENANLQSVCEDYIKFAEDESPLFRSMYMYKNAYSGDLHDNMGKTMIELIDKYTGASCDTLQLWKNLYPLLFGLASLVALGKVQTKDINLSDYVSAYIQTAVDLAG